MVMVSNYDTTSDTYTCAACGGTWLKGTSDDEADAEARELWPDAVAAGEALDVVCDDCFRAIMASLNSAESN